MTEQLIQYLWNFKCFNSFNFKDTNGNALEILDFGTWNHQAGPDFLMAKIKMNGLILVGNIEIHLKSSDWLAHHHSHNPDYSNIILHAVFLHDKEIDVLSKNNIPTLELKHYIDDSTLSRYETLSKKSSFIPCENLFEPQHIPFQFTEELMLAKLNEKSIEIEQSLAQHKNNYEAVLFHYMAYAFGLKINAAIFKQMAESVDFSIINKTKQNLLQLEALLLGMAGWLGSSNDEMTALWKREFDFLQAKFQLSIVPVRPKFLRLRPPNFPTIRLSQLANLYHSQPNLFSKIIDAQNIKDLMDVFSSVSASEYWDYRYNFGEASTIKKPKLLSKSFIEILILNCILPIKYTYHKHHDAEIADEILELYRQIPPESNSITQQWKGLQMPISNALDSQASLWLHKTFCERKKCLNCGIGFNLLKQKK